MNQKLYVGNLPFQVTEDELRNTFAATGEVANVQIITDKISGRSRGFAFVEMGSAEAANEAIGKLDGTSLGGRNIVVREARPMNKNGGGGGGGRRDFSGRPRGPRRY
ncbi:MAG: RNA-binding protein [Deltaproteobacteria bacterium]|nr:RNA-binding protein [Deltaproteobacteria bacterium]